jgi:hypothetical protein
MTARSAVRRHRGIHPNGTMLDERRCASLDLEDQWRT